MWTRNLRASSLLVFSFVCASQALMFLPVEGDSCSDNVDCQTGCCLMTTMRHRRPQGVCQPMAHLGEYCAPGDRLRDFYGSRVYTFSCPCAAGLVCKPAWSRQLYGMSFVDDPKCMPDEMHPYVLHKKGYGYRNGKNDIGDLSAVEAQ